MNNLFKCMITGIALLTALSTFAQPGQNGKTQTVRGILRDAESKQPLIGANVVLVSMPTKGASTDENGEFKISQVPVGRISLKISYIGYETFTVPDIMVTAGKEVVLSLTMNEALQKMNEVVISYDRKKDRTVTNNEVATVGFARIK